MDSTLETPVNAQPELPASSPQPLVETNKAIEDKAALKSLLAEARANKQMIEAFAGAVQSGTFHGSKMLDLAKGLAFLDAILNQNKAHIDNLQERLKDGSK